MTLTRASAAAYASMTRSVPSLLSSTKSASQVVSDSAASRADRSGPMLPRSLNVGITNDSSGLIMGAQSSSPSLNRAHFGQMLGHSGFSARYVSVERLAQRYAQQEVPLRDDPR